LAKRLIADAHVCAICGHPLVPDAPPRSRWSSSVDHIMPLELGGSPFDEHNLRVTHLGCNSSAGAAIGNRSPKRRGWVAPVPPVRVWMCDGRACSCVWLGVDVEGCEKREGRG
jgi:hypothetical protein